MAVLGAGKSLGFGPPTESFKDWEMKDFLSRGKWGTRAKEGREMRRPTEDGMKTPFTYISDLILSNSSIWGRCVLSVICVHIIGGQTFTCGG